MLHYQTIIAGAGPAGCAAAHELASHGKQVLLLDKCEFPRLKPCAGALTQKTINILPFDVTPVVRRVCGEMKISLGEKGKILGGAGPLIAMTVRSEFDHFFVKQCAQRGVDFYPVPRVVAIRREAEQWVVQTNRGAFRAEFLIGADGANSQVRKLLARGKHLRFGVAMETCIPCDRAGEWPMEFDFGAVERGYGWIFPKHDHLNVGLYTLNPTMPAAGEKLAEFIEHKTGRKICGPIHGHRIPWFGRIARFSGEKVCLVGDAAGLIDPFLGEGIFNAVRSGQLAARAILSAGKFNGALDEIREDLAAYDSQTRRFYANIHRGYRRLTRWPLGPALLNGFARGFTVSKIKRNILTCAFASI
jgi:geranylgeranyl reductase family protein